MNDSKRINGPALSHPPLPLLNGTTTLPTHLGRRDGRSREEARGLFAQTGLVGVANGSAYLECGGVKLVCAVYGPKPVTSSQKSQDHYDGARIACDVRLAPFAGAKRKPFSKDPNEDALSSRLATALLPSLLLAHLPKSQIDIYIHVLQQAAPSREVPNAFATSLSLLLAPCITCASLALADAGIEMMDSVVGCQVGVFRNAVSQRLFWMLDCADDEAETACNGGGSWVGNCTVAVMPSLGKVAGLVMDGDIGDAGFVMEAVQVCVDASAKIHEVVVKRALVESAAREL
ncbi:Exosome complex component MTR3 [Podochytrium sp. JEL0797]|nr:Exosome complex component MTR3 [Podochytrium sp. JEL0797]